MDLRRYLGILRRHGGLLVQGVAVAAVAAGLISGLRTPVFAASARVLLNAAATEDLFTSARRPAAPMVEADRRVLAQMEIIRSPAVARAAAEQLDVDAVEVSRRLSVTQLKGSDVVRVTARAVDPAAARDTADAVAKAYLENRRENAVRQLRVAADELDTKLNDLQGRIAEYDRRIGDAGLKPGATAVPAAPVVPRGQADPAAAAAAQHPALGFDGGAAPTTEEALKAARYAAAIQYNAIFARQQEIEVEMSLKEGAAELVSSAKLPKSPSSPKPLRDAALGGALGLLAAGSWALAREHLEDRVTTTAELAELTELPVLAEVPFDDVRERKELVTVSRPSGPLAEAIRSLRTSIEFVGLDKALRRMVVTSPAPGDGKSLVSANLAVTYAQAGMRTILVSADLRRPRVETVFGVTPRPVGFTTLVVRMEPAAEPVVRALADHPAGNGRTGGLPEHDVFLAGLLEEALVATGVDRLELLPAGPIPPNPAELLGSDQAGRLLDLLSARADVVILDTPPLLAVTDAAVLAARSDGVILVTSLEDTRRQAVRRVGEILANAHVRAVGLVVNKVRSASGTAYHYGHYTEAAPHLREAGSGSRRPWPRGRRRTGRRVEKATVT